MDEHNYTEQASTPTSPVNQYGEPNQPSNATKREIGGAAIAGGVAGLVLAGPVLAVAAGAGAAYAATSNSKAGDVARASGNAVASAGDRVKQWDQQHGIMQKTSNGLKKAGAKAKEFDEKHGIMEKTKNGAKAAGTRLKEFDQKHRVVEKTSNGIINASNYVARKLQPKSPAANTASTNTTV